MMAATLRKSVPCTRVSYPLPTPTLHLRPTPTLHLRPTPTLHLRPTTPYTAANIFMFAEGYLKLGDFGVSKVCSSPHRLDPSPRPWP